LLLAGDLGDRYGRKRVYLIGIAWFAMGSLACGVAPDTYTMIVARGWKGVGAALMIPGSLAMITATVPVSRRGTAIGVWSACTVVTTAMGPLLGGLFTRVGWWRGVFLINLPLALIAFVVLVFKASETRSPTRGSIDRAGASWSVCGMVALNLGLIEASHRAWHDTVVWTALSIGLACLIMFVKTERRARAPLLPLQLFGNKSLTTVCFVTLLFYSSLYGMTLFLTLNLIQIQQYDAVSAGLAQFPIMLLVAVVAPWTGRMIDRRGPWELLIVGPVIAGCGYAGLAITGITAGPHQYWSAFLPPVLLLGLGMSMTAVPLSSTIVNLVPVSHAGLASGLNSTLSRLSHVLGVAILGAVALFAFNQSLTAKVAPLSLTDAQRATLFREAAFFGAAEAPAESSRRFRAEMEDVIAESFLVAFRAISWVCAGACWLGALLAACALERKLPEKCARVDATACDAANVSPLCRPIELPTAIGAKRDATY